MKVSVSPLKGPFVKRLRVPPDKSLTHRAYMLAAVAKGTSCVLNPLNSEDCNSTKGCLEACGVPFEATRDGYLIKGGTIKEPEDVLFAGNSGTTARLLAGLLSGHPLFFVITGDPSLRRRPMRRITAPLEAMGAKILGREGKGLLPLAVMGGNLKGIHHKSPVASAQVKSAVLLAGLNAEGKTRVTEPAKSRDHTERMLKALGARVEIEGLSVCLEPSELEPFSFSVPGDPSSAAFWVAAALLVPKSEVVVEDVLLNPTRTGFFQVLKRMGADVEWEVEEERLGEPVGRVMARYSGALRPVEIGKEELPAMIDEVPLFALVASRAEGATVIREAHELRVKESDRIAATVSELSKIGVRIEELEDGMVIEGPCTIEGGYCHSHGDHRMAMTLAVAGLASRKGITIEEAQWVSISYPDFFRVIEDAVS